MPSMLPQSKRRSAELETMERLDKQAVPGNWQAAACREAPRKVKLFPSLWSLPTSMGQLLWVKRSHLLQEQE
ncbi:hypothetical protein Chor_012665 [Crotalus horridus]